MLKNILNLEGAQKLSNNEQKNIYGGTMVQLDVPKCYCNGEWIRDFEGSSCAQLVCP